MDNEQRIHAFDLDGTLIAKNSSFEFSIFLYKKKVFRLADFLFCCSCYFQHLFFKRSLLWLHARVFKRLFAGKQISYFSSHLDDFLDKKLSEMLYMPAVMRLKEAQKKLERVIILSTSPVFLVEKIAKRLGVDHFCATNYVVGTQNEMQSLSVVIDGEKKAAFLGQFSKGDFSIAYSDSSLDIPFLKVAKKGVAVRPDRKLLAFAKLAGWEVL